MFVLFPVQQILGEHLLCAQRGNPNLLQRRAQSQHHVQRGASSGPEHLLIRPINGLQEEEECLHPSVSAGLSHKSFYTVKTHTLIISY